MLGILKHSSSIFPEASGRIGEREEVEVTEKIIMLYTVCLVEKEMLPGFGHAKRRAGNAYVHHADNRHTLG
jgi:hypothetical protein